MTEHRLKCWPQFFRPLMSGEKTFEIRYDDRNFEVGDCLDLQEWNPETGRSTGSTLKLYVHYITNWAQHPGYVVMSVNREPPKSEGKA